MVSIFFSACKIYVYYVGVPTDLMRVKYNICSGRETVSSVHVCPFTLINMYPHIGVLFESVNYIHAYVHM